jgi:hypothetical protein
LIRRFRKDAVHHDDVVLHALGCIPARDGNEIVGAFRIGVEPRGHSVRLLQDRRRGEERRPVCEISNRLHAQRCLQLRRRRSAEAAQRCERRVGHHAPALTAVPAVDQVTGHAYAQIRHVRALDDSPGRIEQARRRQVEDRADTDFFQRSCRRFGHAGECLHRTLQQAGRRL